LEDVDLVSNGNPDALIVGNAVTFLEGGGTVQNVSIMGTPEACLTIQGGANFSTVTIEQVTCRGFTERGVYVDVTAGTGALDKLAINRCTFDTKDPPGRFRVTSIFIVQAPVNTLFVIDSVLSTGGHGRGLRVSDGATLGEVHVDNLTVEDCTGIAISLGDQSRPEVGLLRVTNTNLLRCGSFGMVSDAIGNIIIEDVFAKRAGIFIESATAVVVKKSKFLSSVGLGIGFVNVASVVMDDVFLASNQNAGISMSSDSLTPSTAAFRRIVGLDNGQITGNIDFSVALDGVNSVVTIEDFIGCTTGGEDDPVVSIRVANGVVDIKKEFVSSATDDSCTVQDKFNDPADCSASPLMLTKFESCDAFCSQNKKKGEL
jgi:hypothetical protein